MSRKLVPCLLVALAFTLLAPAYAEAQFFPIFHKTTGPDDDVDDGVMGFPPAHPCPQPGCAELQNILRIINCGNADNEGNCEDPQNPPLTGGVFTDTPPSTLPLDCARGVIVTGDGTWDPPICDVATNTVTVNNINIDMGGTVTIEFWCNITCDQGAVTNTAQLQWDQNPAPDLRPLQARDPASIFGGGGLAIQVGEPGGPGGGFTKDAPNLEISGMPAMRQGTPGTRTAWVIEGANGTCEPVTVLEMQDTTQPVGCLEVDCATLRLFIDGVPTPIPPDTECPGADPMFPTAFTLGSLDVPPGSTFRLEYDAIFTSDGSEDCCNLGNFVLDGYPDVQTSDPGLDAPLMPEATCVSFVPQPEPILDAIKSAEDQMGGRIVFVQPGETIDWRFTIENNGNMDGTIDLADTFPALAVVDSIITPFPSGTCMIAGQDLTCTDVNVPMMSSVEMVVRTTVDCAAVGDTDICNVGNVTAMGMVNETHCPDCPAMGPGNETCVTVQAPAFPLASKTGADETGDGVVDIGETITWTINPLNTGTTDAANVRIDDLVPADSSYVADSLLLDGMPLTDAADGDAGEVVGGQVTVRLATQAPVSGLGIISFQTTVDSVAAAEICNEATIVWDGAGGCPQGMVTVDQACVPTSSAPLVTATKAVSPTGNVDRGSTVTYSIEACADGAGAAASGVTVDDLIPAGTSYANESMTLDGGGLTDAADGDGGEFLAGPPESVSILIGDLMPGECRTVTFDVIVDGDASGTLRNTASVSGSGVPPFDTNEVGNGVNVPNPAELTATKAVSPNGEVDPDDTLTYSIAACNGPMAPPGTGVVVNDGIPAGTTYVPGSMTLEGAPLTDLVDLDAGVFNAGPPASIAVMIGALAPGECQTVTFDVTVDSDAMGNVLNTAQVGSNEVREFDTNETDTPIGTGVDPPQLTLDKSSALQGAPPAMVGNTILYTLTACNDAAAGPATGVTVTDPIPFDAGSGCGADYVASTITVDGMLLTDLADTDAARFEPAPDNGQVIVDIGDMAPGECVVIEFEVTIAAGCDEMESVDNQATLTADGVADSSSNSTSDVVGVDPPAAEMLRNAVVSCREEAVGVYDQIFSGGLEPQIDPMAAATTATPAPASPVVFAGDADTAATNDSCPQEDPAGANLDNRVLVFYEYAADPAATIRVAKSGADIEVSW